MLIRTDISNSDVKHLTVEGPLRDCLIHQCSIAQGDRLAGGAQIGFGSAGNGHCRIRVS